MNVLTVGVIGGTGVQGSGLALRFARARHNVVIGSRSSERAEIFARGIRSRLGTASVIGRSNGMAATIADIVVLSVPADDRGEVVAALADRLAGKTVLGWVDPLVEVGDEPQSAGGLDPMVESLAMLLSGLSRARSRSASRPCVQRLLPAAGAGSCVTRRPRSRTALTAKLAAFSANAQP